MLITIYSNFFFMKGDFLRVPPMSLPPGKTYHRLENRCSRAFRVYNWSNYSVSRLNNYSYFEEKK